MIGFLIALAIASSAGTVTVEGENASVDWTWNPFGNEYRYQYTVYTPVQIPPQDPTVIPRPVATVVERALPPVQQVSSLTSILARYFGSEASYAYQVVSCETGGTFNPHSTGRLGERGLFQIHPIHIGLIRSLRYTWDEMYQVEPNVHVAWVLWREQGWRPWACG